MHLKLKKIDKPLLVATILLTIFGILMVYSASNVVAQYKYDNKAYYFNRQLIFACVGFIVMILIIHLDLNRVYKLTTIIFLLMLLSLILVLVPGIGVLRGGARSWIGIGSFGVIMGMTFPLFFVPNHHISIFYFHISALFRL